MLIPSNYISSDQNQASLSISLWQLQYFVVCGPHYGYEYTIYGLNSINLIIKVYSRKGIFM